jgi:glycosyltransferase involved in cell wall biosynthesis
MSRLAIVTSHPIQYNAPLFKMLASQAGLSVKVFYTLGSSYTSIEDKGFGKTIQWDLPILEGYEYEFLENVSQAATTSYFTGIINPFLIQKIKEYQPSAIIIYGWSFKSHLKVIRYFYRKIPVYFRGDSTLLDEEPGIKLLLRRVFLKWVYKHIYKALYVGTNNRKYFLMHGVKKENLIFVPHAIDNKRFGDEILYSHAGRQLRNELNIPEQNIVFLFSGKFESKKSPLLLLKAFKKLQLQNVSLLMVGSGVLEDSLKIEAVECSNIHFLPFQNQMKMPAVYRAANVLVLPSGGPGETWGLAINEAMACGLAIIASTKVGCAVDLVHDSKNGYIFESRDIVSLYEKLVLCALKSKSELDSMGHVSKEIINVWSYENVCAAIINSINNSTSS